MESRGENRGYGYDGETTESPPPERRRLSMEEDYFYREVLTYRRPPKPPAYDTAVKKKKRSPQPSARKGKRPMTKAEEEVREEEDDADEGSGPEFLPNYSCDVHIEGVFQMKMEIEDTIKRAEYRNWRAMYVVLHGTALNIYTIKKDWGWGKTRQYGPGVSTDNPPWLRKATLERTYGLQYADVGIAADYHKRRYVIRLRAETDQFLLSCVELETFVHWLDHLFAAIDVAAPIDERNFPRDQSIPRIQRLRWLRGQLQAAHTITHDSGRGFSRPSESARSPTDDPPELNATPLDTRLEETRDASTAIGIEGTSEPPQTPRRPNVLVPRMSITSYPNESIDEHGKWVPQHRWTPTHDMVYAKLCYAVLLFKSPRKSNFIIVKGKRWVVDWATGQMSRVLPPSYDEPEFWGPWQHVHMENTRL